MKTSRPKRKAAPSKPSAPRANRAKPFADPDGLLEGEGKTGQHLKLPALDELPREAVRGWLRTTAHAARKKSTAP